MSITLEAKRVKTGQSLTDMYSQAMSAINQLKGLKINLLNLKTEVNADTDFTAEDVVEIDAKLTELSTELATI